MLMSRVRTAAAGVVCALAFAGAANAAVMSFIGTRENVTPLVGAPGGRCGAAAITVVIAPGNISSTGTSNFGNFSLDESHCIPGAPPNPYDRGIFNWAFEDGSTLFGTYSGAVTLPGVPGPLVITSTSVIDGGTGRFLGATGSLSTTGTLRVDMVRRVSIGTGVITGDITVPAIPEPGTWALMIMGFGAAGAALRNRRRAMVGQDQPARLVPSPQP